MDIDWDEILEKKIQAPLSLKIEDFFENEAICHSTDESRMVTFNCENEQKDLGSSYIFDDDINQSEELNNQIL